MGDAEASSSNDASNTFERGEEGQPRILGRDPVCGTEVDPLGAAARSAYRGVPYYFCSKPCKRQFDLDPIRYVGS